MNKLAFLEGYFNKQAYDLWESPAKEIRNMSTEKEPAPKYQKKTLSGYKSSTAKKPVTSSLSSALKTSKPTKPDMEAVGRTMKLPNVGQYVTPGMLKNKKQDKTS